MTGEAFIVTEGRENIELGLMEVKVYKPDSIEQHLRRRHEESISAFKDNSSTAIDALDSLYELEKEFNTVTERDIDGMSLSQLDRYEERLLDVSGRLSEANKTYDEIMDNFMSVRTQDFYLKNAPKPSFSTKTDSDGKFSLNIWSDEEYYILANAERKVSDSTESYFWMERIRLADMENNEITLSNDNIDGVADESRALTNKQAEFVKELLKDLAKSGRKEYDEVIYDLYFPKDSLNAVPDSVEHEVPEGYTM